MTANEHFELGHKVERVSDYELVCCECDWFSDRTPKATSHERAEADAFDAEVIR